MHKVLFENIIRYQSYQSLNIYDKILWFPVQRIAVTQWGFDEIIQTMNVVFAANDHVLI